MSFKGSNGINTSRLSHISELDLTDNLISDWSEVLKLLTIFKSLKFLNLSNNLLSEKLNLSPAALSILVSASNNRGKSLLFPHRAILLISHNNIQIYIRNPPYHMVKIDYFVATITFEEACFKWKQAGLEKCASAHVENVIQLL